MSINGSARPNMNEYLMGIAMAVRARANCAGNRVGAVIAKDARIISTGYNGTPRGMTNCMEGGCLRCANRTAYPSGTGYDLCICVHAEQNALLAAARFGIAVEGSTMYTTMQPCFGCIKEALQAGVTRIYFVHEWKHPDPNYRAEYDKFLTYFPGGVHRLEMDDPDAAWAISSLRSKAETSASQT
ncbi:MAG TPA: dCMP deaminase family protein [Terriglobales bacterium]|nr:dCMP deaminase family protein [Terriglobales bacterium]